MSNLKDKLRKITSNKPSNWKEKAHFRKNNPWLREYSSKIARRVLSAIEENKDLNQVKLAESLSVSPQQISKIVKGQENLTLETIYKLSKALNFELISFPDYKYCHNYSPIVSKPFFFNQLVDTKIDFTDVTSGLYLHSMTSMEFGNSDVNPGVFIQANFVNVMVNS